MAKLQTAIGLWIAFVFASVSAADNAVLPNPAFKAGERLSFKVGWFIIPAGEAFLNVENPEVFNGQNCWHFVGRAESRILFFFKVQDRVESFSSEDSFAPVRFEKHLNEGGYHKDLGTEYDSARLIAHYSDRTDSAVLPGSKDILSAFYYFRTLALPPPGQKIIIPIHADKKNYDLVVEIIGRETVKVPAGEFKTIRIRPKLKSEGLWRQDGDGDIWLTDDPAHIPVKIQAKVKIVGSINIELARLELPK